MNRLSVRFLVLFASIHCIGTGAAESAPAVSLEARFIGQLQPIGLPSGMEFGGGGNVFERHVDVSGTLAVVGAGDFRFGSDQGRAFLFDFSNANDIQQIAELRASDNSAGNMYAQGVAISGHYVFVGASGDSEGRGAVYMYDVSDRSNVIERKITAFDGGSGFGFSLAVDANRLIVGAPFSANTAPAAAYIIDFSDPGNLQQTKITPNLPGLGSRFAESVAISGDYAIVGRPSESAAFPFAAGSAYLYDISDLNAIESKRLTPTDVPNYSRFGARVAIDGTKALVSVSSDPGPTNNAGTTDGAVWAFDFSDWNNVVQYEYGRPVPNFGGPAPPFGRFLDLEGDLAFAFNEDSIRGALYIHDVSNVLAPKQLLRLPAHANHDIRFGTSFAVDGQTLLVSDSEGHVYIYALVPEPTSSLLMAAAMCALVVVRIGRERR